VAVLTALLVAWNAPQDAAQEGIPVSISCGATLAAIAQKLPDLPA